MTRPVLIAPGEWYHCYNRGVDKRKVFASPIDYERFLGLLFAATFEKRAHVSNLMSGRLPYVLSAIKPDLGPRIVELGAYCLMPNHVHLVIKENMDGGIGKFMQRLFTGYTMYFNRKNERTGALFAGTYKAKHLSTDRYSKHAINYVHMNPIELWEPNWKTGAGNLGTVEEKLRAYKYSSLPDHLDTERQERKLLGKEVFALFDSPTSLSSILFDAQAYYKEMEAF